MSRFTLSIIIALAVLAATAVYFVVPTLSVATIPDPAPASADTSTLTYTDLVYGFSFEYPSDLRIQALNDPNGYGVLAEKPNAKIGFQVFLYAFDEPGPLTEERIKQDLPDAVIENVEHILIGATKDIEAVTFLGHDETLGTTREVWFIWPPDVQPHGNYLYQVTSYADGGQWLSETLDTWRFKD